MASLSRALIDGKILVAGHSSIWTLEAAAATAPDGGDFHFCHFDQANIGEVGRGTGAPPPRPVLFRIIEFSHPRSRGSFTGS